MSGPDPRICCLFNFTVIQIRTISNGTHINNIPNNKIAGSLKHPRIGQIRNNIHNGKKTIPQFMVDTTFPIVPKGESLMAMNII